MHSPSILLLLSYLISHVSSATVLSSAQPLEDQLLAAPFDASSHTLLLNNTAALSLNNISDLHAVRTQCNGPQFGTGLNPASCTNAMLPIPSDSVSDSFGTRDDGHSGEGYDVQLP